VDVHDNPHDPLLDELRALAAKHDPVPPLVVETAKASLGWRRLDADLAELLTDSVLEDEALSAARGHGPAAIRSASFGVGVLTIDVDIEGEGAGRTIRGQIAPPTSAPVQVQAADEAIPLVETTADQLGRFRARLPEAGAVRLRIAIPRTDVAEGPEWIETSWIPL
jgi:hypothetical protein